MFLFSFVWGKRRKSSINEVNPFNLCLNIYGNVCLRYFMLLKKRRTNTELLDNFPEETEKDEKRNCVP